MKPIVLNYHKNEWEFIYPPSIDNEKVQNILWEGIELLNYNDFEAEKIFKSLIKKNPYFIDAYNHLSIAFKNQNKRFESFIVAEKSYNLGKECFPKEFNTKKHKLIWSNLDNRPFLRACQTFGLELQDKKEFHKAIEVYKENLNLNENDNQGIRYLILECHFSLKDYTSAKKFIREFPNDLSMEFQYGRIAIEIIKSNVGEAEKLFESAKKINAYLPQEIIKEKHKAPQSFKISGESDFDISNPVGLAQEAYDHWSRNKTLYRNIKLIEFFKDKLKSFT